MTTLLIVGNTGGIGAAARIVLLAADRVAVKDIVERVGASKPTVIGWKKRYAAEGIGGLADRPKPDRPAVVDEVAVVLATLERRPERLAVTHCSSRLLADELGISHVWVSKILAPLGAATVAGRDVQVLHEPELEAKVRDVVGLYLNPPDKALTPPNREPAQLHGRPRRDPGGG